MAPRSLLKELCPTSFMASKLAMAVLVSFSASVFGQSRPDVPVTSPPQDRIVPLDVTVNGEKSGTWPFVDRQGTLHVSREALDEWRVRTRPGSEPITLRGAEYWPLSGVPGFSAKTNFSTLSVEINFASDAFTATRLSSPSSDRPALSPVLPSAFVNYEFNYGQSRPQSGAWSKSLDAIVEAGASNEWGVLTSNYLGRDLTNTEIAGRSWTRLETTFTKNLPDSHLTLRLGDGGTRTGLWGRTVYFGGLQLSKNYSMTPGFLTQPLPVVTGVSAAPSTVELYVNDVLRQVSQVPAGPFAISNTAALSGSGEARLVVRDLLGREVVLTQPFFSSISLLAPGLSDWSVETGLLRKDIGQPNSSYSRGFGAGTWRYGISDRTTVEARGEGAAGLRIVGLGAITGLPGDILARSAYAISDDEVAGRGHHWTFGAEKQWFKTAAYAQVEGASQDYRALGVDAQPIRLQWAANLTHTTSSFGSFGLAAAHILPWTGSALTTVSANYSVRVADIVTLSVGLSKALNQAGGVAASFTVQVPLERNRQTTLSANARNGEYDVYATASETAASDAGLSWRVLGGRLNESPHAEAGAYYEGRFGRLYSDVSTSRHQTSVRAGGSGGLVVAAGHVFATRRVDQSYAVAEVKDQADIGVGLGSNELTRTDGRGLALVPNLGAYQPNYIRLNPQDLALSVELASIEKVVVPAWRSAVKADFPVRGGRAALIKLELDDGEAAPAGAVVRVEGDQEEYWVARRGEAYVTGLPPNARLRLTWKDKTCQFTLALPSAGKDEIPRVGPLRCRGVPR